MKTAAVMGMGLVLLGSAIGARVASATGWPHPRPDYQAVCQKSGCDWAGPLRGADLRRALADAYGHGSQTGHFVWVRGPINPRLAGVASETRGGCRPAADARPGLHD